MPEVCGFERKCKDIPLEKQIPFFLAEFSVSRPQMPGVLALDAYDSTSSR